MVLSILAFVSALVALNAPPARSGAGEEAERFAARLRAAWEDAVFSGAPAGIALTPRSYKVERYVGGQWRLEPSSRRFSERALDQGVSLTVALKEGAGANERREAGEEEIKRIVLDPIGAMTPFTVEFADSRGRWRVMSGDNEEILVERVRR